MKILGEAKFQALAKINPISEVLLRSDLKELLIPIIENIVYQPSFLIIHSSSSIFDLAKNHNELIKITSNKR